MGVPFRTVLEKMPEERQAKIKKGAASLIKEYESLQEFRKDAGITQKQLAKKMSTTQVNISNLEKRDDMHLSTLRSYVEALGGTLEITIRVNEESLV